MPQIAIVDPALGRTGAHNRGFVEMLLDQGVDAASLAVCCSTAMSPPLRQDLAGRGLATMPVFDTDFYQVIGKPGSVVEHWDWIYRLSQEYLEAFERILRQWPDGTVHLLYHTLSWEHASALGLAIRLAGASGTRLRHLAFLMYSPGVDTSGAVYDAPRSLNFRLAFGTLSRLPGVNLYAGCGEYATAYARLLGRGQPLPIHPCFLGDWRERPRRRRTLPPQRILLYVGEIKQDKGFLDLPALVEDLLGSGAPQRRYVVQFVDVRNPTAAGVLDRLQELAARNRQLELHHGFLSEQQLRGLLADCDLLSLNYDPAAYVHKTSGLLWLAAWHGLAVWVPEGSWLEREARRLGVAYVAGTRPGRFDEAAVDDAAFDPDYFQRIFTPFRAWLEQQCAQAATADRTEGVPMDDAEALASSVLALAAAPRAARQRPEGASVVLFWKQNDTCLYGRRCDMVIRYLASRPDVGRVVVLDAPVGEGDLVRLLQARSEVTQHQRVHELMLEKLRGDRDTDKVSYRVFVHSHGARGDGLEEPEGGFLDDYVRFLRRVFEEEGVEPGRAVFWIYPKNFEAPRLIEIFRPARTVIDVVDDHRAWPGVPETTRQALTGNYRTLLGQADLALANCVPVQEAMLGFCPRIRLVPNACDGHPPAEASPDSPAFRRLTDHAGPVIGFVGNLEAKIDVALLHRVAERFGEALLVLLGSTHANPAVLELRRHPNVLMPGVVPYPQLGSWLRRFDVGLVPHLDIELTRHMNPLKPYVYLSWNVPVVATGVRNLDTSTALVRVAADHARFIDAIAEILGGARPTAEAFRQYVATHDWASRLAAHVDELELARL